MSQRQIRILAREGLDKSGAKIFEHANILLDTTKVRKEDLPGVAGDYDGMVVRSKTKVTRQVIEAGAKGKLKIVGRQGSGFDNIDTEAASEHGIIVKTSPLGNTRPTAELALALMFSVARSIPQAHYSSKNGWWEKKKFEGIELYGKTLGIIGCGRIGKKLAEIASAVGMYVIGYDVYEDPEARIKYLPKDELVKQADFISIHVAGTDLVLRERDFALMRPSVYIINAARAENMDHNALYSALKEGKIAGAALDVHEDEPDADGVPFKSRFRDFDNVILTQHMGVTKEAKLITSADIAQFLADFLIYRSFANAVNIAAGPNVLSGRRETSHPLFICHDNLPGTFSPIEGIIATHGINIHDSVSEPLKGGQKALTIYDLYEPPAPAMIAEIGQLERIHSVKE